MVFGFRHARVSGFTLLDPARCVFPLNHPANLRPRQTNLTQLFSIDCRLFRHLKKVKSIIFSKIQPLFAKHLGWGMALLLVWTGRIPDKTDREDC